ncbi:MAG: pyridoxal 5'-phosphate synthase glutaminase subunit PdxT [Lachnospiraceae bacterium]|nr:pyridoxal 5'-phosphate synthase glutaminase subunit PdxT [Lachnospiraceae bacterium]
MKIAVLAVQGAFAEHIDKLRKLGAECLELRQRADLEQSFEGLILPGGESTVQGKLLRELQMFEPLRDRIRQGLPVLGTCAGLILLSHKISNDEAVWFGTLPVCVQRNAYGRQLGSFHTEAEVKGIGRVPMTFIRAPYVESLMETPDVKICGVTESLTPEENFPEQSGVEVLARVEGRIVAVRYENQIGTAFHPELDEDDRIHEMFLQMCREQE